MKFGWFRKSKKYNLKIEKEISKEMEELLNESHLPNFSYGEKFLHIKGGGINALLKFEKDFFKNPGKTLYFKNHGKLPKIKKRGNWYEFKSILHPKDTARFYFIRKKAGTPGHNIVAIMKDT